MDIKLIVDSGSDYTQEEAKRLNYEFIPLSVTFGNTTYLDGIDLDHNRFYELLDRTSEFPKSASPAPQYFHEAFTNVQNEKKIGLYIALAGGVSSTYQTGKMVSEEYSNIYVIDSESVSVGVRVLIEEASKLVKDGKDINYIVDYIERYKKRMTIWAYLGTLDYLKKGGRISTLSGVIGSALDIRPIVQIKSGKVELIDKNRGKKKSLKALSKLIQKKNLKVENMYVGYSGVSDKYMREFIEENDFLKNGYKREIYQLGPTIGSYGGSEVIGIVFIE